MTATRPRSLRIEDRTSDQAFHDRIVQQRPETADAFIAAGGMNAVGQQHHRNTAPQINPEGRPSKSKMPDAFVREIAAAARLPLVRTVETQGPPARAAG